MKFIKLTHLIEDDPGTLAIVVNRIEAVRESLNSPGSIVYTTGSVFYVRESPEQVISLILGSE